jgi:cell division protein FtsB
MIKKKFGVFVIVIILLSLFAAALPGKQGLVSLYQNHNKYRLQKKELINAHKTIDSLKTEIDHLRNDTDYIEKIAREKLGMARKNELIYKFVKE